LGDEKMVPEWGFNYTLNGIGVHRMIFDESGNPFDCEYLNVNTAFEEHTGLRRQDLIGRSICDLYPRDEAKEVIDFYATALRDNASKRRRLYFKPTDSWFDISVFPTQQHEFTVAVQNITEAHLAEEEIRKYKTISDKAVYGNAIADSNGHLTYVNHFFAGIHGYEPDELIGQHISIFHTPEQWQTTNQVLTELMTRGCFETTEIWHVHRDGTAFPMLMSGIVLNDSQNDVQFIATSAVDITDRKRMESELSASEESYRRLYETMSQGVVYQKADGTIIAANPAAKRILDLLVVEISGTTCLDRRWKMIKADGTEVSGIETPSEIALRTGKSIGPVVRGVYVPDRDAYIWLSMTATPLSDPGEKTPDRVYIIFEDITVQKQVEEKLIIQKQYLETILETTADGFWVVDRERCIHHPNTAFCRMMGYSKAELEQLRINDFEVNETPADTDARIRQIIENGPEIFEVQHRRKDGHIIDVSVSASVLDAVEGLLVCFCRDITEQKRTEAKMHANEAWHRRFMKNTPDILYRFSSREGALYWSDRVRDILGYEPEEMKNNPFIWNRSIHPDDRSLVDLAIEDHQRGEQYNVDYRIKTRDGRWIWLNDRIISKIVLDDDIIIEGHAADITDRKEAEAALEKERWRLNAILAGTNVGTWEWNVQTGETVFNERWAEIIGYTLAEISPVSIETWQKFTHPDDLTISEGQLKRVFEGELDYYDCEVRMRHRNGDWVWVQDRGKVVIRTDDGQPLLMVGTHQDITDRIRMAEAENERLKERLALEMWRESSKLNILQPFGQIDFQPLADFLLNLSGAKYAAINTFDESKTITRALAGPPETIDQVSSLLGSEIIGKPWDMIPERIAHLRDGQLKRFKNIHEAGFGAISKPISHMLHQSFALGEIYVIAINHQEAAIGDLIMFMPPGHPIQHPMIIELFAQRVGIMLMRMRAEQALQQQLKEKETLLHETHHRIKNHISAIDSLLSMQARTAIGSEVKTSLNLAIARVRSMAELYDKMLISEDYRTISSASYFSDLVASIIALYPEQSKVTITERIDDFPLSSKKAFPVGIILNELLTNTMKYAFVGRDTGNVSISLSKDEDRMTLIIEDDGVGLAEKPASASKPFGLNLVRMLADQLDGVFSIEKTGGTRSVLTFTAL
jgi:PAS domain S-box-containing protein